MSKRKPLDKAQARERRNQLLASAAAAELSLTEGVRAMRAIAGMTQEDFARHRGVSARVIKAIELGQGNPTVATLNRIGQFFGLEVAFVPIRRAALAAGEPKTTTEVTELTAPATALGVMSSNFDRAMAEVQESIHASIIKAILTLKEADDKMDATGRMHEKTISETDPRPQPEPTQSRAPARKNKKPRSA